MRTPRFRSAPRLQTLAVTFILTLLLAPAIAAQTQSTTGTIEVLVFDSNGAVVSGADVEIKNLDTNAKRNGTTDDDGRFIAPQLQPGNYSITVSKTGFQSGGSESTSVTVGDTRIIRVNLPVSGVSAQVTVTETLVVDTQKTQVSTTLNDITVATTPILGRKFLDLLPLTPGVAITQGPDGDEINFAGQRGVFNNVTLDGGDYNNGFFGEQLGGQRAAIDITLEAVKEFQVVATGASAEFGRTAGGVINVITKSGSNDIHGSLFHFQRLEALTANTSDGQSLEDFHREQFGGTISGPMRRDKAFFFFAFEGINENLTRPNLSVPIGDTPCPIAAPTIIANESLINGNADCQRLALINFFRTSRNQEEGLPISHKISNQAVFARTDFHLNSKNDLVISYNFDHSKNTNQTFDV
ncbi:MAG TPA: TonB-dependent receptor, partial [Pyrinomonadaceae bacterium]|nr:TonB-dependent receptor [Pyrinomonadaceae bacterium]